MHSPFIFLFLFTVAFANLDTSVHLNKSGMSPRLTNIGNRDIDLYPGIGLPEAVNLHPYDPNKGADGSIQQNMHPLALRYNTPDVWNIIPPAIQNAAGGESAVDGIFINVQDNPWGGTPILLRPHAYTPYFPGSPNNITAHVRVLRDDGTSILAPQDAVVSVHDLVASPDNMPVAGMHQDRADAFYSLVTVGGRTVITRHILLTVPQKDKFLDNLCTTAHAFTLASFTDLLGAHWTTFLTTHKVIE